VSFFWFQNDIVTNYAALDANAVDDIGSEDAYYLSPEKITKLTQRGS